MPLFDHPELKVQKDRKVCRNTDTRIAKYSRRGMLFTLVAFAIAVAIGELRSIAPKLVLVLAIGLVLVTLIRGYYVFRFGHIYATGPKRWRHRYFLASTIAAVWWGVILLSHVFLLGFSPATQFLWLYTVVFCASVASVFSPYHRFLTWFLAGSLVPAALQGFLTADILGAIYGALTLAFVWLMAHQARRESENYWDRVAAMQALQQKASNLAAARKHSEAAVEVTNEFLANVGQEFRSQLSDSLGALALLDGDRLSDRQREWVRLAKNSNNQQLKLVDNVGMFTRVARKDIHLRQAPFNLVRTMEKAFKFAARSAQRQRLEFNFQISEDLPVMVTGDNRKTAQLIRNLVDSATVIAQSGELWGEASFEQLSGEEGQLTLKLVDNGRGEILPDESELFGAFSRMDTTQVTTGLGLNIAKGLAEAMGGYLQLHSSDDGNRYVAVVKFAIEPNQRIYLQADRRLQDTDVLLLHQKGLFVSGIVQMLQSFGMNVTSKNWDDGSTEPMDQLMQAMDRGQLVVLAPAMGDARMLSGITQVITSSQAAPKKFPLLCMGGYGHKLEFTPLAAAEPEAQYLARPVTRKEFHDSVVLRLFGGSKKASRRVVCANAEVNRKRKLLLIEESRQHLGVTEEMLQALGYQVEVVAAVEDALARLPDNNYDLVLVDCQQNTAHSAEIIEQLRLWENEFSPDDRLPIVALTSTTEEQFEGRCLAAGMDDYLTKPLSKDSLAETLERWLGE
ncbi:hybrid sensor histidine kinase/response regulator [Microbulbifer sp. YPW1]|uniref:hybrid sensor histidine kinase/response regulator n=1 Tax=Microbulbifer sp. YPW1 TaxID=2745199 RepID=UPI001598ECCE|nr:hybrid sensor histidine kinase/response regulator [Microbulbifer sp. YPW1]QKX18250.1 hybrid sensor histidine kinase/response regulator [Microbulbifer sp. YPW1]